MTWGKFTLALLHSNNNNNNKVLLSEVERLHLFLPTCFLHFTPSPQEHIHDPLALLHTLWLTRRSSFMKSFLSDLLDTCVTRWYHTVSVSAASWFPFAPMERFYAQQLPHWAIITFQSSRRYLNPKHTCFLTIKYVFNWRILQIKLNMHSINPFNSSYLYRNMKINIK